MGNQHKDSADRRSSIGSHAPSQVGEIQDYVDPTLYATWSSITGLSATVSDVLDDLGYKLAVPTSEIPSVFKGARVIGRAVTLKYLPERRAAHAAGGHLGIKPLWPTLSLEMSWSSKATVRVVSQCLEDWRH